MHKIDIFCIAIHCNYNTLDSDPECLLACHNERADIPSLVLFHHYPTPSVFSTKDQLFKCSKNKSTESTKNSH